MQTYPWGHTRRFNSYTEYFRKEFGERVQKVTINAGFSCPNRDGTVAFGGCTFCNNSAFNPSYNIASKTITLQIEEGITFHKFRYRRASKYLAYFQAFTNTHAPLADLKRMYEEALSNSNIIGLVIGTRPDCIDAEKLDYLAELSKRYYIIVEYGIETSNNQILKDINRGHDYQCAVWAVNETKKRGIKTGAHYIIGFPGQTENDYLELAKQIAALKLDTVKFHQLQIVNGTAMKNDYEQNPDKYTIFSLQEYLDILCKMIVHINPETVIERIASEIPPKYLFSEGWGLIRYDEVLRIFEQLMEERDIWQGKLITN